MSCDYEQDPHGCIHFRDWEPSLEQGCRYKCFRLGMAVSYPQKKVPVAKQVDKAEELPIEPLGTPTIVQQPLSTGEVIKTPISQENPLLGPLLIAAVTSISMPLVKDFIKSKIKKKESDDQPIECKPAQVKTNKQIKSIHARLEGLEKKENIHFSADELDDIKKRIEQLEKK